MKSEIDIPGSALTTLDTILKRLPKVLNDVQLMQLYESDDSLRRDARDAEMSLEDWCASSKEWLLDQIKDARKALRPLVLDYLQHRDDPA